MREPIYITVKKELENKIEQGIYKSGDKIPSERELSEMYNISRMTARQAINELVSSEMVKREKGRGTFVTSPQLLQKNIRSFTETLSEQGYTPITKLIEFCTVFEMKEISKALNEPKETKFYKIKRLRFANSIPVALETVYIPKYKCEKLNKDKLEGSLYNILEEDYGYKINNISCDIDAVLSNRALMKIFNIVKPITLLKVEGISITTNGEKLLYEESYYRSNLYKYHVDIYRR